MIKLFKKIIKLIILAVIVILAINVYVVKSTEDDVTSDTTRLNSIAPQCIMVLGASVYSDGTPSPMLEDRLNTGIWLYKQGVAPKLLLTGDNGQVEYNEVAAMREYALNQGVPEEDIFLDHAGFSTYESVYRASYIFDVQRMVVVTQKYHLYRALYGCESMGMEAMGVPAGKEEYSGQELREMREILARNKDFIMWIVKPAPTFLGDEIPISGTGKITH